MRKQFILLIYTIFLVIFTANAQYNYYSLPDSMKKDADYIIWEDYREFKVIDEGKAVEHVKFAVLITDQYARRYERKSIGYNKNLKLSGYSGTIYNASGKRVKKLGWDEIEDVSAVSSGSLFEDNRRIILKYNYHTYPYTIVYEYKRIIEGILSFPYWSFQGGSKTSVLSSKIEIILPENMKFDYKEYNLQNKLNVSKLKKGTKYTWEETNLVAKEYEGYLPSPVHYEPMLITSPVKFKMDDYGGSMDSWDAFGKWNYELNQGRDVLSVETYKKIKDLTKDAKTDREKAKILYEYMQGKTRYVSVQLGIGGWQTFPAQYVDENAYGDCKALSNYMYTMLKLVGVKSHYVLVNAGRYNDDIISDFPSNQFNHVILCIPQEKDTIWLECTDQQQPFGFLGRFTDNRHVLLVDENGGKLVKTPEYTKEINLQTRNTQISVGENGNALLKAKTVFSGLNYEAREREIYKSVKDQKKFLHNTYDVSGAIIKSFSYKVDKSEIPSIIENLEMDIPKLASVSSKRMFLKMNLLGNTVYVPKKNTERKRPFEIKRGYVDIDTIKMQIPETYKVESLPSEKNYVGKFGGYATKINVDGTNIVFVRKFYVEKGFFAATEYMGFYNFRKKIKKADRVKVVLVKKTD